MSDIEKLIPEFYRELRTIAAALMKQERHNHTLQPTALINEAYLKMANLDSIDFSDRKRFFGAAAQTMRRLLIDHARGKRRNKRGGEHERVTLQEALAADGTSKDSDLDILALNEALTKLQELNPEHAQIVELRYFLGLTLAETATVLDVSTSTIERSWRAAKVWLRHEIKNDTHGD